VVLTAGVVGGLGYSEGETAKEQLGSAATGGLAAAGLVGAGKLIKEVGRVGKSAVSGVQELRPTQESASVFREAAIQGDEKLPFDFSKFDLTESGRVRAYEESRKATDRLIKDMSALKGKIGKEYEAYLNPTAEATKEHLAFAKTPIEIKDTLMKFLDLALS